MIEYYQYQYRGFKYRPKVTEKKEIRVIEHVVLTSENKSSFADFSPYCFMSQVDFKNYIDLGLPKRAEGMINPYSSDTLRRKINKK